MDSLDRTSVVDIDYALGDISKEENLITEFIIKAYEDLR